MRAGGPTPDSPVSSLLLLRCAVGLKGDDTSCAHFSLVQLPSFTFPANLDSIPVLIFHLSHCHFSPFHLPSNANPKTEPLPYLLPRKSAKSTGTERGCPSAFCRCLWSASIKKGEKERERNKRGKKRKKKRKKGRRARKERD